MNILRKNLDKVSCWIFFVIFFAGCASTEVLENRISRLEQENALLRKETTDINIKLEEAMNLMYVMQDKLAEQAKMMEELKNSSTSKVIKKEKENTPDALYRSALDLLQSGKVLEAEKGFRDFIHEYSDHPLADNAQYWLGECFYARKDYHGAITEFNLVLTNYPGGDKICDAKLKIGYSYIQIGDTDNGVKYLNEVINECSGTPVAKKAAEKINLLGRN